MLFMSNLDSAIDLFVYFEHSSKYHAICVTKLHWIDIILTRTPVLHRVPYNILR